MTFAYHSVVDMPADWWSTPAAYIITILAFIGTYCAINALLEIFHKTSRYTGKVQNIHTTDSGIVELEINLDSTKTFRHQPGQFVFINFGNTHGAHPFTIAGADSKNLRFAIKALGDFTSRITEFVHAGQKITIEGPYGHFNFKAPATRQIWIAAGIGITPFMAQLEHMATHGTNNNQQIDLWYCTNTDKDAAYPQQLESWCEKANVQLHRFIAQHHGFLNTEHIIKTLKLTEFDNISVWFCGPQKFAKQLKTDFINKGLPNKQFQTEIFNFR